LGATGIVLSACYSFWLYGRISYGSFSPYLTVTNDVTRREFMLLISLIIPIVLFGIVPNVILDTLHVSVTSLLYNISITTPSPDLDLSFSFLLATTMGKKIQSSYSQKTCNTISSKNGNTSIEPLDSNSSRELGGLQSHSVESVKILAKSKDLENFLNWLSGFSDAESTFHIKTEPSGKTAPKISFSFKIGLHVDDIDTLKQIKSKLTELAGVEVGNISVYKLSATLAFTNLKVLKALIIPIFNAYPLISAKYLDFKDWEKAINIKSNAKVVREETLLSSPRYLLTLEEINKIIKLKEGMNSSRNFVNESLLPQNELNPYWFLGFCEGESSFTIQAKRTFSPRFAITQNKKSITVLNAISKFIYNLPFQIPKDLQLTTEALASAKLKSKSGLLQPESLNIYDVANRPTVSQLLISSQNLIFYHLLAFFESLTFLSRKGFDFELWSILIKLRLANYHKTEEGRELMERIVNGMNSARYTNYSSYNKYIRNKALGKIETTLPTYDEISNLISKIKPENGCSIILPINRLKNHKN